MIFIVMMPTVLSLEGLLVEINERGKTTSYYDEFFIVQVNGTINITNPSSFGLYNVRIPINLYGLDLRSTNNTVDYYITNSAIFILSIEPNVTLSFDYKILGISSIDLNSNSEGVLKNALLESTPKIYSSLMGTLQKAPLEDESISGNTQRVVSVELRNPTSFSFSVDLMKVIKTSALDINTQLNEWDFSSELTRLDPYSSYTYDLLDDDAVEGEIYWLQSDVYIDEIIFNTSANVTLYTQDDLFEPLSNITELIENDSELEALGTRVFLRKVVSSRLVNPTNKINITMIVSNFGSGVLFGSLFDNTPKGFKIFKLYGDDATSTEEEEYDVASWDVRVDAFSSETYKYEVELIDGESVGVDYFPASSLLANGETFYSQSVPFVRQYIPEKKIFIQKTVDFLIGDEVSVTISVQNLGESTISNLLLKEYLPPNGEFKEITKEFQERGVWKIEELKAGEKWETKYVTGKTNVLNTFPEIFGVDKLSVLKTIILSNVVETRFLLIEASWLEFLGAFVIIVVLVLYLLPIKLFTGFHSQSIRDLQRIHEDVVSLRKKTQDQIRHASVNQQQPAMQQHQQNYQKSQQETSPKRDDIKYREEQLRKTHEELSSLRKHLEEKEK